MERSATLTTTEASNLYGRTRYQWAHLFRDGEVRGEMVSLPNKRGRTILLDHESVRTYLAKYEPPDNMINVAEAAERLSVSKDYVGTLIERGVLRCEKRKGRRGPTRFVHVASLKNYSPVATRAADPQEWRDVEPRYRLALLAQGLSQNSVNWYSNHISLFARWCDREGEPLIDANREVVTRWLAQRYEVSKQTGANSMLSLRSLYRFCIGAGSRSDDPTAGLTAKRPQLAPRQPYTEGELRALISATRSARDLAIILTLIGTGVRRAELLGMQVDDIDWERSLILVRKGKGDKQRWVAPGSIALRALQEYIGDRRGQVWVTDGGDPLTGTRLYQVVSGIGQRAGVAHAYVHRFRVTMANLWLDKGGDILALQQRMGHANIEMTAHYARFNSEQRGLEIQRTIADSLLRDAGPQAPNPAPVSAPASDWLRDGDVGGVRTWDRGPVSPASNLRQRMAGRGRAVVR